MVIHGCVSFWHVATAKVVFSDAANLIYQFLYNHVATYSNSVKYHKVAIIIIYVYQLGSGGRTQKAEPVLGVYP